MKTLQQHIDDLDRMVDTNAAKPDIRHQISFIAKEIAAFEAEFAALQQAVLHLHHDHTTLQSEHSKLKKAQSDRDAQAWDDITRSQHTEADYSEPGF